jgi:hypothetical protein
MDTPSPPPVVVWQLSPSHVALELPEPARGPALELHLVWLGGATLAWWCDDRGRVWTMFGAGRA